MWPSASTQNKSTKRHVMCSGLIFLCNHCVAEVMNHMNAQCRSTVIRALVRILCVHCGHSHTTDVIYEPCTGNFFTKKNEQFVWSSVES